MPVSMLALCAIIGSSFGLTDSSSRRACSYVPTIIAEAEKNDIEPSLLAAVIMAESSFVPWVTSPAGACGLTQVIPRWTGGPETKNRKYTCEQLKNPKVSIKVGAQILSYNIRVYAKGNVNKGLCFYSTGTICLRWKNSYDRMHYIKIVKKYKSILDEDGC